MGKPPTDPSTIDQIVRIGSQKEKWHNSEVKIRNEPSNLGSSSLESLFRSRDLDNLSEDKGSHGGDAQVQG